MTLYISRENGVKARWDKVEKLKGLSTTATRKAAAAEATVAAAPAAPSKLLFHSQNTLCVCVYLYIYICTRSGISAFSSYSAIRSYFLYSTIWAYIVHIYIHVIVFHVYDCKDEVFVCVNKFSCARPLSHTWDGEARSLIFPQTVARRRKFYFGLRAEM